MGIELTALHWIYVFFIACIITFFIMRKDTTLICVIAIFVLGFIATNSLHLALSSVFNSFIYAITELLPTILIISVIVSLSNVMMKSGVNDIMISPFTKLMKTPSLAYWTIGIIMMVVSWFFWPSPAVATHTKDTYRKKPIFIGSESFNIHYNKFFSLPCMMLTF